MSWISLHDDSLMKEHGNKNKSPNGGTVQISIICALKFIEKSGKMGCEHEKYWLVRYFVFFPYASNRM